jgi:hypothetical protein
MIRMRARALVSVVTTVGLSGTIAGACLARPSAEAAAIPCPGPATVVIENSTAETYDVWWFDQLLGSARPGSTRLAAPSSFPCRSAYDCRGLEFRDRQGRGPRGAFRGTVEYRVECR